MTAPLLTASIVTFYTEIQMLKAAIASFKACELPTELLIVDNTPDASYFNELQTLSNVRVMKSPGNFGFGFGHNFALNHCPPSCYHLILNPDVIIHPGCLEALVARFEQEAGIGMIVPKVLNPDGSLQPLNKRNPNVLDFLLRRFMPKKLKQWSPIRKRLEHFTMLDVGYEQSCDVPYASGCFMLFRRHLLEALGGFDERFFMYFEDADITRRLNMISRTCYCPDAIITHEWGRGSYKCFRLMRAMFVSAYRYFQKWGWRFW